MIYNHPSAFIYTPRPSNSSSLSTHLQNQWTPTSHVGGSEGPVWSPHLKSQSSISARSSSDLLNRAGANPTLGRNSRGRSRVIQELGSSIASPPASPLSPCFSLSEPSEDEDQAEERDERAALEDYQRRMVTLEAMAVEPSSPVPSFSKAVTTSSHVREE